jgi:peptidoglycan-associated lipoprotein
MVRLLLRATRMITPELRLVPRWNSIVHAGNWLLPICVTMGIGCGGAPAPDAHTATPMPSVPSTAGAPSSSRVAATAPSTVSISDEIRSKCGIADADAYFTFDSAHLRASDRTPLDSVVRCFTSGPLAGHLIKLVGRADPRGTEEYNLTLGQSRADAVALYLAERGLGRSHATSTSRGAMDATGSDETGWQRDRRVDVLLGN